jgi:hypothetical protein
MNKRVKVYAAIGVVIVLLGFLLATTPRERLLYDEEYMSLEFYPMNYYFANFTVASSDTNAEFSFDINLDFGGNYTSCTTLWVLYQLLPEQFEETFNLTEVHNSMSEEDWEVEDFGAFWAGWFIGNSLFPFWEPVPSGAYVLVFWIDSDGSTTDWSAALTVSLRTSILPHL